MIQRLVLLLLAVALAAPLEAQRVPRRPRLPAEADTNDAAAYFEHGRSVLERDAPQAEAAFYWAARLDPMSPQSLYAQGIAALLRDKPRLVRWLQRDARTLAAPAVRAIDSLRFRAEMQDPFFHRGMEELLLFAFVSAAPRNDDFLGTAGGRQITSTRGYTGNPGLQDMVERFLQENDPFARGTLYYSQGQLREALAYWTIAMRNLERSDLVDWIWAERARAWSEARQLDSAIASLRMGLRARRGGNDDPDHHVYEARSAWQYALGRLLEDRRDTAAAREAYEQTLGTDQTYYPALLRLGVLALQQGDTAGAAGAIRRAVDRPDVQFFACTVAATLLERLGRRDAALAALRRATEVEPFASAGWLMLARSLDVARDAGAVAAYERYIALAPRGDGSRPAAMLALTRLRGQ